MLLINMSVFVVIWRAGGEEDSEMSTKTSLNINSHPASNHMKY